MTTQPSVPSTMDLGFGVDQGNLGPFVTMADKQFASSIAMRALFEIPLSQAALDRSSSDSIHRLAQRMIDDYSKWSSTVNRASTYLKISIPATLDTKQQQELDRTLALTGPEFDQAYLKTMIHLQNKALSVTHYETDNAGVTGFRTWAGVMLPALQEQLKLAQDELNGKRMVSSR